MLELPFLFALVTGATAYTEIGLGSFMFKDIDPIGLHGKYGSHMHTFFGSDAVTLNTSTSAELRTGCTTATNPNDLSTYWVPTLYFTGSQPHTPISPGRFSAYYENLPAAEIPFPENYKVSAGNFRATTQAETDPFANIKWYCEGDPPEAGKDAAGFPTKTCSTHLQHLVFFPDCVNPQDVSAHCYSGVQNWNATFKPANRCPEGMKRIPRLRMSIRYDVRKVIAGGWDGPPPLTLSSGPSYSGHGDFFNGWEQVAALNMLGAGPQGQFHFVDGPRGKGDSGPPSCMPRDADPGHGTNHKRMEVKWVA